jgi:exopolysaccharide biosynthesis polyprenyl glycosylphosphotransferase
MRAQFSFFMNDKKRLIRYGVLDWLSALLAWLLFNVFRFNAFKSTVGFSTLDSFLFDHKALMISFFVPFLWIFLYYLTGYYVHPRRKTPGGDALNTFVTTLLGVLVIFFIIIVDDYPEYPELYYEIIVVYFLVHAACAWFFRLLNTRKLQKRQARGELTVPVLIIGTGEKALQLVDDLMKHKLNQAYKLVGCIRFQVVSDQLDPKLMVGTLNDVQDLVTQYGVEEVIVAIDNQDVEVRFGLLNKLYALRLPVKAAASAADILSGHATSSTLFGIPMINLTPSLMPYWQQAVKQVFDCVVALACLVLLMPLFLYLAIRVKLDTKGEIFFKQERVGKKGKVFHIYKFRTMFADAEELGPRLSHQNDTRVTPYGRFMRRYRLDELPQFINVLKGDMSLVGPRPERQFFVDQIIERAPHYFLVQQVTPGITSWGMVKFGYADSVDKMIRRLEYDVLYLENQTLLIDLKILLYTLKPLFSGKGV